MSAPNWIIKLQKRWNLSSVGQVLIVLLVFACTGFTVMFLKPVIQDWLFDGEKSLWFSILYWIFILPVYNFFLLLYGFIFGKFKFFWAFEKRMFRRMSGKAMLTKKAPQ